MRARRTARSSTERVAAGAGLRLRLRLRGAGLRPGGLVGKEGALKTAGSGGGRGLVAFEKQNILYLNKFIREPEPVDCEGTATQTYFPSSRAQSRSTWTRHQNLDRASLKPIMFPRKTVNAVKGRWSKKGGVWSFVKWENSGKQKKKTLFNFPERVKNVWW